MERLSAPFGWYRDGRALVRLAWRYGLFCVLAILSACATGTRQRNHYLGEVGSTGLTNIIAFHSGTNLQVRFPVRGKDIFAHASWADSTNSPGEYRNELAALIFEKEGRTTRRTVMRDANRIAVRSTNDWQRLVQQVVQSFVPRDPNAAALLLLQNQELAVFRDSTNKLNIVRLEKKPARIAITQTFRDSDFSRRAIELLQPGGDMLGFGQTHVLFASGHDPAFVFVDVQQRLVVFISGESDPEIGIGGLSTKQILRTLHTVFIKSLGIEAIKNPFTVVARGLWHFGSSGAAWISSIPASSSDPLPPLAVGASMDLSAWENDLDQIVSSKRKKGRLELLIDGERFFTALIQALQDAERSIDFQVYIFDTDDYATKIADILKERAQTVRVRVMMDDLGSLFAGEKPPKTLAPVGFQSPPDIQAYLRGDSKVSVRKSLNPWLTGDHRKCIIIDEKRAFLGGMNIGREYRSEWHDMMVGITGPVVNELQADFHKAWAHEGPLGDFAYAWVSVFDRTDKRKPEHFDGIDIRPLRTKLANPEIYRAQLEAIRRAKRYIYIENSYFVDEAIMRELAAARRRGVDVRVVLPDDNDIGIMQTSNQVAANALFRSGIRVYLYPGMTHIKAAIYDGWACLGSANFNKMSLRICQELDVAFSDPTAVDQLKHDLFELDFAKSKELTQAVPSGWLDNVVKIFADQL